MRAIIDCNTCMHHVQGGSIDGAPPGCWNCVNSPFLPNWKAKTNEVVPQPSVFKVMPVPATASQLLKKASDLMDERGKQYDQPEGERSMGKCVSAFNTITGKDLTEAEGWLLLQLLKDVRQWQRKGYHQDSAEDCIAYAALKAEAKQSESVVAQGM